MNSIRTPAGVLFIGSFGFQRSPFVHFLPIHIFFGANFCVFNEVHTFVKLKWEQLTATNKKTCGIFKLLRNPQNSCKHYSKSNFTMSRHELVWYSCRQLRAWVGIYLHFGYELLIKTKAIQVQASRIWLYEYAVRIFC